MYHTLDSYMNFIYPIYYPIYMERIILPEGFRFTSKMKRTTKE